MPKDTVLTQDDFEALLLWFSPDREEAGAKYEEIRNGLIRYFNFKGCSEPENLADETINRVAKKFSTLDTNNSNKHITFFYGFASNIYKEFRKKIEQKTVEIDPNLRDKNDEDEYKQKENKYHCLDKCLGKLSEMDRHLAIQYFCKEKSAKFEHRRQLAEQLELKMGTLHVKVHRLKSVLRNCLENCLKEK
ncbi:MAG: hypothetical protein K1X72_00520 [Pyrinomonadaceae bacterium]|nr:hypothetical protein [Pyrinomonadaceae bacterium]